MEAGATKELSRDCCRVVTSDVPAAVRLLEAFAISFPAASSFIAGTRTRSIIDRTTGKAVVRRKLIEKMLIEERNDNVFPARRVRGPLESCV
jgi:hypothetical protein